MASQVSDRQLQANRQNAQLSTGPRTPQGKARSSRNALTLGLFSSRLLLPGEDAEQLRILREGLLSSLRPSNVLEAMLVERIVAISWKLQRTARAEQVLHALRVKAHRENVSDALRQELGLEPATRTVVKGYSRCTAPAFPPAEAAIVMLLESDSALEKLQLHESKLEHSILRLIKELRELRKARKDDDTDEPQVDFSQIEATAESNLPAQPDPESAGSAEAIRQHEPVESSGLDLHAAQKNEVAVNLAEENTVHSQSEATSTAIAPSNGLKVDLPQKDETLR